MSRRGQTAGVWSGRRMVRSGWLRKLGVDGGRRLAVATTEGNILIKRVVIPSLFPENIYWYVVFFSVALSNATNKHNDCLSIHVISGQKTRKKQDFPFGKITVFSAITNFELVKKKKRKNTSSGIFTRIAYTAYLTGYSSLKKANTQWLSLVSLEAVFNGRRRR